MAAPTDEELQALAAENRKLRDKIASAQSTRAEREAEQARIIRHNELKAENFRLQAQLSAETEAAKVGNVKEGASTPLQASLEMVKLAEAQSSVTIGPVDTNAENPPKDTGATVAVNEGQKSGGNS